MVTVLETKTQHRIRETEDKYRQRIINGLFYDSWNDEATLFTGLFNYSKGKSSEDIGGLLEDCYGRSRIEGLLSEQNTLSFNKTYGGRPPIDYKFSWDKEIGLYVGTWKGKDAFEGHSVCKLDNNLIQADVDFILEYFKSFVPVRVEEKSKAVLDYMVEEGHLYVSRDSISGKEMLSLSEKGKRLAEEAEETITPEEKRFIKRVVDKTIREVDDEDEIPF